MSAFDHEEGKREIIIVKRGGGDHEDGHHGGVWKIAFADFMTAMMCFFLVMWLVNAANEETKAAVASYFNPMTLVDDSDPTKGLDDQGETPDSEQGPVEDQHSATEPVNTMNERSGPAQHANSLDHAAEEMTSDEHLFSDPYAVLAEIAAETAMLQNVSAKGDGGAQTSGPATGADGGESYRDPFAPDFWSQEVAEQTDAELDVFREPNAEQAAAGAAETETSETEPAEEPATEAAAAAQPEALDEAASDGAAEGGSDQLLPVEPEPGQTAGESDPVPDPEAAPAEDEVAAETEELARELREEIAEAFGADEELNQAITVTPSPDGVLISLTDELNYGMFEVGSAVPQRELVLAMEKIGAALDAQEGTIRINGHTDGRPFRSAEYDNWRLSTARAHSAYYMLVRAGMDETRVREVAGFADRELKVPDDPFADANRRIEIFLETRG